MSDNDRLVLDSSFATWVAGRGAGLPERLDPFTYYVVEQFLKPYDPNDDDIIYGITDGRHDGSVDAIYFILNRSGFVRDDTAVNFRDVTKVRIVIFQVKTGNEGFKTNEIRKFLSFTDDLFNLSLPASSMASRYHAKLITIMHTIKSKYLEIVPSHPEVTLEYFYVVKRHDVVPGNNEVEMAAQIERQAKAHLSHANFKFHFVNAPLLLRELQKRSSRSRQITLSEAPMHASEGFVGLVNLKDYYSFISDDGELAEHIFEANVRGFQQDTSVNMLIRKSLRENGPGPNFWLLNNGITIIAEAAPSAGHRHYELLDPQVVNGLQTSREIFNYFHDVPAAVDDPRSILVRVLPTTDDALRDAVIKATNSQNKMDPASLRAFDPVHSRIEEVFKRHGLYYDRRKGYYKDKGLPVNSIVSVMDLLKATVAVVLQRPDDARARSGDYIKVDEKYKSVFGEDKLPLLAYLRCFEITRRVSSFLDSTGVVGEDAYNLKFHVVAAVARELTGETIPSAERVANMSLAEVTDSMVTVLARRVLKTYLTLGGNDTVAKGTEIMKRLNKSDKLRKYRATRSAS